MNEGVINLSELDIDAVHSLLIRDIQVKGKCKIKVCKDYMSAYERLNLGTSRLKGLSKLANAWMN